MSVYDVTDAFEDLYVDVDVSTSLPGSYVKGHWVTGGVTTLPIQAAIQPASNADVTALFPQGDTQASYKIFRSPYLFKTADKTTATEADLITYKGAAYKVLTVSDWIDVGGYSEALAVKQ